MLGAQAALESAIPGVGSRRGRVASVLAGAVDPAAVRRARHALPGTIVDRPRHQRPRHRPSVLDAIMRAAGQPPGVLRDGARPASVGGRGQRGVACDAESLAERARHRLARIRERARRLVRPGRLPPHARRVSRRTACSSRPRSECSRRPRPQPTPGQCAAGRRRRSRNRRCRPIRSPSPPATCGSRRSRRVARRSCISKVAIRRRAKLVSHDRRCRRRRSSRSPATATRCGSRAAATVAFRRRRCRSVDAAHEARSCSRRRSPELRARARSSPVRPVVWLVGNGSSYALHLSPRRRSRGRRTSDFPGLTVGAAIEARPAAARRSRRRQRSR